jgi:AAA family ATP:ADP antiporter
VILYLVNRRESDRRADGAKKSQAALKKEGGFQLVVRNRYLRLIAMLVLLLNCVNSLGEYILSHFVLQSAEALPAAQREAFIGAFYGDYFTWVNLIGLLLQTFVVARLFQWIGVYGALFVLPSISLSSYAVLATVPIISIVRGAKILENSTDYSINNTVRAALFLPTSREAKYKGKAAIDTFFTRLGDMGQYAIVFAGTKLVQLTVTGFAYVNMALAGVWILLAWAIAREYKRMSTTE